MSPQFVRQQQSSLVCERIEICNISINKSIVNRDRDQISCSSGQSQFCKVSADGCFNNTTVQSGASQDIQVGNICCAKILCYLDLVELFIVFIA